MLRDMINDGLKDSMKSGDKIRLGTLRLINAAIKDRDIEARGSGRQGGISDDEVLSLLQKMVKQRQESAGIYEQAGRMELATQERDEIAVIQSFMPKPLTEDEARAAIKTAIAETGAESVRDMGRVIAALKERHAGRMDFAKASGMVKEALS
ncbi:aspartyl-tRNA amidotransferase subunit B [Agaricicola taiwanensis]|uniref:Aspartyl-tRNA amidotransferase subunit B n=1 Tax=Agaricicola taiwanensis TaxID=591372 RepID=A0A8J2VXC5_9RHOB|nr:GatB/YqeY domain-containing protein [Agaricicola taiwanensis]GGE42250.1 aspartyl-tRNA amidotransferase subunit B [Agaricicola taiwanensis]